MEDGFIEAALADQERGDAAADAALERCHARYSGNDPPAGLIEVLVKAPINDETCNGRAGRPLQVWPDLVLLYLDKYAVSAEQGSILLRKASYADCLPDILGKMLETNPAPSGVGNRCEVWKAMVLAIMKAKKADLTVRLGLRECRDHFNDEAIRCIHRHVKTRDPKSLAPRVAAVLPNDLHVMEQWMSLCEAQKTDVAIDLLSNMMHLEGSQSFDIQYHQSMLGDVRKARQEAPDLAKSWLDLYRAFLHYKIGDMLWQRGNEEFKVGHIESADEKKTIDDLETWLEYPNNKIAGKDKLLHDIRTDREQGGRRKSGHIWHATLAKKLYESRLFKSVEVEQKVSGDGGPVDILLEDESGKDVHIEAWDGVTEMTHKTRRMILTGERFDMNKLGQRGGESAIFEWRRANKWLNKKVSQLPQTGRNFVVAQRPQHEIVWRSMDGVNLKDNACAIQIDFGVAHVWCKNRKLMGATALSISKALGCRGVVVNGSSLIQFDA